TELQRTVVTDAQTSGGLLLAVDPKRRDELCERLRDAGGTGAAVGRLVAGPAGRVEVVSAPE
ncbi:MAG TPA: selenide, water dikinase SelD, partial [Candidatus Dormibacteraeota bacterium]